MTATVLLHMRDLVPGRGIRNFFVQIRKSMSRSNEEKTETVMVEMVFPNQTNHYGTLFGGQALELMDKCAFITASRFTRKAMVTVSSEKIDFRAPAKHGSIVEVIGSILKRGNTSVTVGVKLFAEALLSGDRHLCAEGSFVLVAVDAQHKPVPIDAELTANTQSLGR